MQINLQMEIIDKEVIMSVYTDYIAQEVAQNLKECSEEAKLDHHFFQTPLEPIVGEVGKVNYGESNYAVGPLTKTIFVSDTFGTRYKISVEDLRQVKGHGFITYAEAEKLGTHYDRDLGMHVVSTPEYKAWLAAAREKNFPTSPQMSFDFS